MLSLSSDVDAFKIQGMTEAKAQDLPKEWSTDPLQSSKYRIQETHAYYFTKHIREDNQLHEATENHNQEGKDILSVRDIQIAFAEKP